MGTRRSIQYVRCVFCGAALLMTEAHVCIDGHERPAQEIVIARPTHFRGPHEHVPEKSPPGLGIFDLLVVAVATSPEPPPPLRRQMLWSDDESTAEHWRIAARIAATRRRMAASIVRPLFRQQIEKS